MSAQPEEKSRLLLWACLQVPHLLHLCANAIREIGLYLTLPLIAVRTDLEVYLYSAGIDCAFFKHKNRFVLGSSGLGKCRRDCLPGPAKLTFNDGWKGLCRDFHVFEH